MSEQSIQDVFVDLFFVFLLALLALVAVASINDSQLDKQIRQVSLVQDQSHLIAVFQGPVYAVLDRKRVNGFTNGDDLVKCVLEKVLPGSHKEDLGDFIKNRGLSIDVLQRDKYMPLSARFDLSEAKDSFHLIFEVCCEAPQPGFPLPHAVQLQVLDTALSPVLQEPSFSFDLGVSSQAEANQACLSGSTRLVPIVAIDDSRIQVKHWPECKAAIVTLSP